MKDRNPVLNSLLIPVLLVVAVLSGFSIYGDEKGGSKLRNGADGSYIYPLSERVNSQSDSFPRMKFKHTMVKMGRIREGDYTITFPFTNTGNAPLVITGISSTCACLAPKITSNPINPGDTAYIKGKFFTWGREGRFHNGIRVVTNEEEKNIHYLQLKGKILERK